MAGPRDTAALINSDVRLTCAAVGDPSPVVSWLKDGDPVIPSDYFQLVDGGSLRILGVIASDAGMYQCMAGNTAGSTQATAQLVVLANGMHPHDCNFTTILFLPPPKLLSEGGTCYGPATLATSSVHRLHGRRHLL